MGINLCRDRAWGPLVSGAAYAAAIVALAGCQCANPHCRCNGGSCVSDGTGPVKSDAPPQSAQRAQMGGGQPIMPVSVGWAEPGKRLAVLVTLPDPNPEAMYVKVTPILKTDVGQQTITFDKVGKIEYMGQPYDVQNGMKVSPNAKYFTFDIVLLNGAEIQAGPPDVLGCIFEMTINTSNTSSVKSYFGMVVDLP